MGSIKSRSIDLSSSASPSSCSNFFALRNKIARCSGSRSFLATISSGRVFWRINGNLLLAGKRRAVTESFNEMESIDLDRVLIRGTWVEGRGRTVSRFDTDAAGRCRLGEDRLLGLPSIVSNGILLLKRTLGPESLEEEETVDEVESLRA
jgi:hypothetical protein